MPDNRTRAACCCQRNRFATANTRAAEPHNGCLWVNYGYRYRIRRIAQAATVFTLCVVADIGRWMYRNAGTRFAIRPHDRTVAISSCQRDRTTCTDRIGTRCNRWDYWSYHLNRVRWRRLAGAATALAVYPVGIATQRWGYNDARGRSRCAVPVWYTDAVFNR